MQQECNVTSPEWAVEPVASRRLLRGLRTVGPAGVPTKRPAQYLSVLSTPVRSHMLNQPTLGMQLHEALDVAASALRRGDPAKAAWIYREILQFDRTNPDLIFSLAIAEHQVGRYEEAQTVLVKGASDFSDDARFPMLLGRNCKALGKLDDATIWYRRALEINPDYLEVMVSLGIALWRTRRFDEAVEILTRARQKQPQSFEVVANLGNALFEGGKHEEALEVYREALALRPGSAEAHNNLGRALVALGRKDEASGCFERALSIAPNHAEALYNLGNARLAAGDVEGAATNFTRAVQQNTGYVDGYLALAKVLFDLGAFDRALQCLDVLQRIRPEDPEGHIWRGLVLRERGDVPEAIKCFERVAMLKPDSPDGYALLGSTYWIMGEHEKAAGAGHEALLRDANYPPVLNLQGNLSLLTGRVKDALGWYERAVTLEPTYADAFDNLLFVSNYDDEVSPRDLYELHSRWGARVIDFPRPLAAMQPREANDRLRLGFVSPDFRNHSVAYFVEGLFNQLDRTRFDLYLYSSDRRIDSTTMRLGDRATRWTNIAAIGDDAVAETIAKDKVDILIDLAGHTSGNRLGVFARKPAPVQVTWLGYPTTTGLPAIRYRLTDAIVDPAEETSLNAEEPLRLPASYFCYCAPADAPPVGPLPAAAGAEITFGSFNNLAKISPTSIRMWADVLRSVPHSKLLLKNRGVGGQSVQRDMAERFREAGVDPARVEFMGWESSTESHLAVYNRVDIALDTYPYNGATTTCESLWMGVPVVSMAGKTHASRMGASILAAAGLARLAVHSEADYRALALGLANDPEALARLRSGLRETMRTSALMDHGTFTRSFEDLMIGLAGNATAPC